MSVTLHLGTKMALNPILHSAAKEVKEMVEMAPQGPIIYRWKIFSLFFTPHPPNASEFAQQTRPRARRVT